MNEEIKNIKYITPNTEVYLNFSDVKIFFEGSGGIPFLKNDKLIDINAISQGRRSLIIGEPGVGKSLLLEKINERLIQTGEKTEFIRLRENDAL